MQQYSLANKSLYPSSIVLFKLKFKLIPSEVLVLFKIGHVLSLIVNIEKEIIIVK